MTAEIFSDARRTFEVLPGVGCLEHAVEKLAQGGVDQGRIREWALSISEEYGILSYVRPSLDRMMAGAAKLAALEG